MKLHSEIGTMESEEVAYNATSAYLHDDQLVGLKSHQGLFKAVS